MSSQSLHIQKIIPTLNAMTAFAQHIASLAESHSIITLQGDLGAGKTEFARAFIRYFLGPEEPVPSPTFNLLHTYDTAPSRIWHFDLYRLKQAEEIWELGFEEALTGGICLIEWPERLMDIRLDHHLNIMINIDIATQNRLLTLTPDVHWQKRLEANERDANFQ